MRAYTISILILLGCMGLACSDSTYTRAQTSVASPDAQQEDTSPTPQDTPPPNTQTPDAAASEDTDPPDDTAEPPDAPEDTQTPDDTSEGMLDTEEPSSCTLLEGNTCQGRTALMKNDTPDWAELSVWALPLQGTDHNTTVLAHQGNALFVAGKTSQRGAFDSTRADCPWTLNNNAGELVLAHYRTDGGLVWTTFAGGNGRNEVEDIAVWADGGAVITGSFGGRASFGCGEDGEATLSNAGDQDMFLARYNADGTLAWSVSAGGEHLDWGEAVAALPDGAVLVTGRFIGEATFGAGSPQETTLTAIDPPSDQCCPSDMFLARYSPTGTLDWVVQIGGVGDDTARGIAAMSDGGALVVGSFGGTLRFPDNRAPFEASNQSDGFIIRFARDGTIIWAKQTPAASWGFITHALTLPDGSVAISGSSGAGITLGEGEPNAITIREGGFLARIAPDGALRWARPIVRADALTLQTDAVILAASTMREATDFGDADAQETVVTMGPLGDMSPAIARYSTDGAFIGAQRISGANSWIRDLKVDEADPDALLITNTFLDDTTYFSGAVETTLTAAAQADALIMRFDTFNPNTTLCSPTLTYGLCAGDQRCDAEGQCQPRACQETEPTCGATHSTSSLEGVRLTFDAQPCVYTLSEARAGIAFNYAIAVDQNMPDIIPSPQDYGSCGGDDVGGFDVFGVISGDEQRYCLCDVGLCFWDIETAPAVSPQAGVYPNTFVWDGINWSGPSDFGNPPGEPFPTGDYTLTLRATGHIPCEDRTEPYVITSTFRFTLVDD